MQKLLRLPLLLLAVWATAAPGVSSQEAISEAELLAFKGRHIGPTVTGGRIHDVEALSQDPSTIYVASASGGLWKSVNRGISWTNLWEHMPVSTFGDVAISPSRPEVVYVGTGEQQNRQSTSWGNGVYRSTDGGATWEHLGLEETRHTGRVQVHPTNPDIVWVAAQGNLWRPSPDRGVYRSTDGGRNWDKVLYIDEFTGGTDLVVNPSNPDILYAATYQRQRTPWGFNGGGPGSAIYRSTDGGDTWHELTGGIPSGDKGRIGLAISASNPSVLNALVEHATESGVYRTEDGGDLWEKVNDQNIRPMYYSHIHIDPTDENRVYTLATTSHVSQDGGRTFEVIAYRPTYDVGVHADHHAIWIDPGDPEHFYLAGDAGLHETYDMGVSFRRINNLPIGQFYGIGVDNRDPYWIYGGMQDNHSWMGPSATRSWEGILEDDWRQIGYGDGMYQQVDPDGRTVYSNAQNGNWTRFDNRTGDMLSLAIPDREGDEEYRWDWASPSLVSKHDPNVVYMGGSRLFVSRDRGNSFAPTDDLTKGQDRDTLTIMGIRGADITLSRNDGTSSWGEIVTISESPLDPDVLWVGTDDGNVQVTRDGTRTWNEVSSRLPDAPPGTYVSRVLASTSAPGTAYVTLDAHRDGDFAPYVYRSADFGQSWTPLHSGLPTGSVNVIIEHPDNPDVLFLGTEHHVFASTNRGNSWAAFPDLPTTAYDDMVVHPREKDLVLGTHGRSIIIVDDVSALAHYSQAVSEGAYLFGAGQGTIMNYWKDTSYRAQAGSMGENPADGTLLTYRLGAGSGPARLIVRNAEGEAVRILGLPSGSGLHRVNWDLRHGLEDEEPWAAHDDSEVPRPLGDRGPFVSPGIYTVELVSRGVTSTRRVDVRGDPDLPLTVEDYREREAFLLDILELQDSLEGRGEETAPLLQDLRQLYSAINGGGVRQGSLYPPTDTQRGTLERIRARLRAQGIVAGE
ncbi:MAG: glycosyl hydrolase [Gemmatimonadota bacterium]|nr:glycosyl hydrolase [Gemmatimonadota bacterium]